MSKCHLSWECKINMKMNQYNSPYKLKKKNYWVASIDTEKTFDKIHHPFKIKYFSKIVIEGNFLNIQQSSYLTVKELMFPPLRSEGNHIHSQYFNIILKIIAR